ncbi:hypothetical protein EJ06DRAFT_581680 [Trichodelitschia bisporula]|uniref:Uncharacterized protein n=1 Tax=Trichodelitschia bisporula TaxID=703511 RepID=A0A6G1HXK3_9PEZI|nr:hypothetical protein EJ06DRAFT_581680 [Trichodelitschia bisporula]
MTTGSHGSMIVSFDDIKLLEHPDNWIQWEKEMKQTLKAARYNDLLSRNRTAPTIEDGETAKDFRDRLTTWKDKQEQAVAIIEKHCGPDAEKHIASLGSAYFRDLDRKYQELRLADCKDVTDFAQRLGHAYQELVALDASVRLSEHFLVNKFLNGLGEDYDNFITAFEQNHRLLPLRNAEKVITTAAVSFSTVRKAVQEEEHKRK